MAPTLSLLPGPVPLAPQVQAALAGAPRAHRWPDSLALVQQVRRELTARTGVRHVALLTGSGTTANDVVAAQLRLRIGPGLVLTSGEFGDRLVDAGRRAGLDLHVVAAPDGEVVAPQAVARALVRRRATWVWTVHCETSTGTLFDLPGIVAVCRAHGAELAVDAISSLGCAPVDLDGVGLATASSGKALAGFPGLAVVLSAQAPRSAADVPRSLDLTAYTGGDGVPCTLPTTLVAGLMAALRARPAAQEAAALAVLATIGAQLRQRLRAEGLTVVAAEHCAAPAVLTVQLPGELDPETVADRLARDGFLLAASSGYLRRSHRLQISLMGRPAAADLEALPALLSRRVRELSRQLTPGAAGAAGRAPGLSCYAPAPGRRAAAPAGSL